MRLWQCLSRMPIALVAAASLMVVSSVSMGQSAGWQSSGAGTGGRIALVIGNSAYADAPLRNPVNDARLMSDTLRRLGFEVIVETDADQKTMKRAIQAFGEQLDASGPEGIGLFYYAGHGVQSAGTNYLIPVNALIGREADLEIEAVSADWVLTQMEFARNNLNIVVLDACRNNPFARSFRSASRGLARMDAPSGSLLAYATAPGDVASDGEGANSPYTGALVRAMSTPGLKVEEAFKQVRINVMDSTAGQQVPWEASSLTGDFFFAGNDGSVPTAATAAAADIDREALFWESVKDSENPADLRAYLDTFPDGLYAPLARNRLAETETAALGRSPSSAPAPQVPAVKPELPPAGNRTVADLPDDIQALADAAARGEVRAQMALAAIYFDGVRVDRDLSRAIHWLTEAAEQGNPVAQTRLGGAHAKGVGVAQDDRQAAEWFAKAAEQGNLDAMAHLGGMYAEGRGVGQNDREAVAWLRKAALKGQRDAQFHLGAMFLEGRGVRRDLRKARFWIAAAAKQGQPDAIRLVERLR